MIGNGLIHTSIYPLFQAARVYNLTAFRIHYFVVNKKSLIFFFGDPEAF